MLPVSWTWCATTEWSRPSLDVSTGKKHWSTSQGLQMQMPWLDPKQPSKTVPFTEDDSVLIGGRLVLPGGDDVRDLPANSSIFLDDRPAMWSQVLYSVLDRLSHDQDHGRRHGTGTTKIDANSVYRRRRWKMHWIQACVTRFWKQTLSFADDILRCSRLWHFGRRCNSHVSKTVQLCAQFLLWSVGQF